MKDHNPGIIRESANGISIIDIDTYEFNNNRTITCYGTIENEMAFALCRQIEYLAEQGDEPIKMIINSPGGEVLSGMAIYDVMKAVECEIHTVCIGHAASMASVLLAAGDRRFIMPNSLVMIHNPLATNNAGSALIVKEKTERLMNIRRKTAQILSECTGKPLGMVHNYMDRETYFDAQGALKFGLVDEIIANCKKGGKKDECA